MSIKQQISSDLKEAMRAKDKPTLETLRLVSAAVKQVEVDERVEIDDERMLNILDKLAKQRKESINQFEKAGRNDLVDKEAFELKLISKYLPEPLSDDDIQRYIKEVIAEISAEKMSDMGKVMALLKPKLQGRADMSQVSAIIKAILS